MVTTLLRLLAAALVSVCLVAVSGLPAEAATPGCITRKEFHKVPMGSTLAQARRKVDARGRIEQRHIAADGSGWISVRFLRCDKDWDQSWVYFGFDLSRYQTPDGSGGFTTTYAKPWVLNVKHWA